MVNTIKVPLWAHTLNLRDSEKTYENITALAAAVYNLALRESTDHKTVMAEKARARFLTREFGEDFYGLPAFRVDRRIQQLTGGPE